MPSAAVHAAFKSRLSNWHAGTLVDGQATTEPPVGVDAFLVLQYPVVTGSQPVLGKTFFEDGAARLVLNVKRDVGLEYGMGLADDLADLFRDAKFSDVQVFTPSAPIIRDDIDDGNWIELSVIVPYRYQFND